MSGEQGLGRREFLRQTALAAVAAGLAGRAGAEGVRRPPNIVFVLTDDLGWADLGCYGSTFHETPRLDALAGEGLRFTQAYSSCPVCSPSRAAIMTGLYPARIGLTDFLGGKRSPEDSEFAPASYVNHLPLELTTLPELLKKFGYSTAAIGKWHLGGADSPPAANGFDESLGSEMGGGVGGYFAPKWRLGPNAGKEGEYLTDRITEDACAYIRAQKDKPFFLYVSHFAPHIPLQAKQEHLLHFEAKKAKLDKDLGAQANVLYSAMLASIDESVGRLLDTLKETELERDTIFIFTSDNGGLNVVEGANTPATDNAPLREGKGYLYEGGIRVPLIIRWPGVTAPGVSETPFINTGFLPTLCQAVGMGLDALPTTLDGISMYGLLRGLRMSVQPGPMFWHYPHFSNQGGRPGSAVRDGDWKLIEWHETGKTELFDLSVDPGEKTEVSAVNPEKAAELKARLAAWREAVGAKMPPRKVL